MVERLNVLLNDRPVGSLTRLPGAQCYFGFDDAYANDPGRPTLSQFYLSADGGLRSEPKQARNKRLPTWFSNLLPEVPLRTFLAQRADVRPDAEFDLLNLLGNDLPGAVQVVADGGEAVFEEDAEERLRPERKEGPLRFSLAGVQLKFSGMIGRHGGMTIPASGTGGDWIVKLPSAIYPSVPENEMTMLTLASQIGMEVPEHRLVPMAEIDGLPQLGSFAGLQALAVKRFDRGPNGQLIHAEDLAQVFGVMPDDKYERVGFARIAELIGTVMGSIAVQDFVARLVFMVLIGNGDMHLKNWSLLYPDGITPQLSPAYDLVSTLPYIPEDSLALNLVGKKAFSEITRTRFASFAQKAQISERETLRTVERTVSATLEAWKVLRPHAPMEAESLKVVDGHMQAAARRLEWAV